MNSPEEVKNWYNTYTKKQLNTGVNLRHFTIINHMINYGFKKNHKVLEIGCGIGTLTQLIYKYINKGKLVATDISDESVQFAKARISTIQKNIEFFVTDMTDFEYSEKFDFIVLPDVLEHIPIAQHPSLFAVLSKHTHDESVILIHIPHPKALDFIRKYQPEKLQIIDQSIGADELMQNAYLNDFYLIDYQSYSVFNKEPDYALVVFKKNKEIKLNALPKHKIIFKKLIARIKFKVREILN
jgi:SAM-dependent methyltransferase